MNRIPGPTGAPRGPFLAMNKATCPITYPADLFHHGGAAAGRQGQLDFSISINPLGPPASALTAIRQALPDIARYPDSDCLHLKQRLAEHHQVDPVQMIVANGSNELIHLIARAFRPGRVAIAEPTYTEYLRASLAVGATVQHWLAEPPAFTPLPFDPEDAQMVWLCNPNNPTGHLWPADTTASWIVDHPATLFVVDEAFLPFLADEARHSLISLTTRQANLIVLRSMTKFWALPGLRLGCAVAHPNLICRIRACQEPWSVNVLAQAAGLAILDDQVFAAQTHAWLGKAMSRCLEDLKACRPQIVPLPSPANFLLLRLPAPSRDIARALAERGILVRGTGNFVGMDDRHLRIGLRGEAENRRLADELRRLASAW